MAPTAENLKEVRHPAYSDWIGRKFIKISGNNRDTWLPLWNAVNHTRRVVAMYNAAIGAPKRQGAAPMALVPATAESTEATVTAYDDRTPEEINLSRAQAYTRLMETLGTIPKHVALDYISAACDGLRVPMDRVIIGAGAVSRDIGG